MTKLLTIEVDNDRTNNEIILIATVISDKQENILILKDLMADQGTKLGISCYGIKLHYAKQFCLPEENLIITGNLYLRISQDLEIPDSMEAIANILLSFIS